MSYLHGGGLLDELHTVEFASICLDFVYLQIQLSILGLTTKDMQRFVVFRNATKKTEPFLSIRLPIGNLRIKMFSEIRSLLRYHS